MFGKEVGGALAPLLGASYADFRRKFQESLQQDHVEHAVEENTNSYTARVEGLQNAVKGLEDQIFVGLKPAIESAAPPVTSLVQSLAGLPSPVHEAMGAILTGGTAIAGLKTAGTLANLAGAVEKFALGAEQASPVIRVLGGLAAIEFGPAVVGLGLLTAGIEAFVHRAEIAHALDLSNRDDFDRPDTAEQAASLRDRRNSDLATIAERQRAAMQDRLSHDTILGDLEQRRLSLIADLRTEQGETPAIRAAREARDQADRANPLHDPEVFRARDQLYNVQEALKRRDAITNDRIVALQKYLAQHQGDDPNSGDADLDRMKARRAELHSALPSPDSSTPELEVLNGRIEHREALNRQWLDERLQAATRLLEDARDATGAPHVAPADLDHARSAYEAAKRDAQARHDAEVVRANEAVKRAQADAEAALKARPEVVQVQRQIDDRREEVQAQIPADDEVVRLRREVDNANRALVRYEREVEQPERDAYGMARPAFTRPENAPHAVPPVDYAHPAVPRTSPAFGLMGPQPDLSGVALSLRAMLYPNGQPGTPQAPQKVDVHSDVNVRGTVEGKGDVTGKVDVALQPSPYFLATVRRAELAGTMALHGGVTGDGGGDYMGGPNGVVQQPGRGGMPI